MSGADNRPRFKGIEIINWAMARGISLYAALKELTDMERQLRDIRRLKGRIDSAQNGGRTWPGK